MTCCPGNSKSHCASSHSTLRKDGRVMYLRTLPGKCSIALPLRAYNCRMVHESLRFITWEKRKHYWLKMLLCNGSWYAAASRDGKVFSRDRSTTTSIFLHLPCFSCKLFEKRVLFNQLLGLEHAKSWTK